jgi:CheY-like chemotaxis protein
MDRVTIYSKTGKGLIEIKTGCKNLTREHARVLAMVDGAATVGRILDSGNYSPERLQMSLDALAEMGLVRIYGGTHQQLDEAGWDDKADTFDEADEVLPVLEVEEISAEESVQAWAQARKGASELMQTGFYALGKKSAPEGAGASRALSALVVEDDEDVSQLLQTLLADKGFAVHIAPDIRGALLYIAQSGPPDLVLLDVVLPGMPGKDGFDVLAFIHRREGWSKVPVVMVTSQVSDDQVMRGLKTNADAYIFKPFKWETLYACIKTVVGI